MKLEHSILTLKLRHPFQTARSSADQSRQTVIVHAGRGSGEAAPTPYYGETVETVEYALVRFQEALSDFDDDAPIETIIEVMRGTLGGHAAARSAIESALWDAFARRLNIPLWQLWGLDPRRMRPTSYTIGLDALDVMQEKARQAEAYPILKVKLGTPYDVELVRGLRDVTDKPIRVDANTAWTPKKAIVRCQQLAKLGVELVEQPVHAEDLAGLRFVREHSPLPIFADESVRTAADVVRLAGCVDGINIKLAKCGGPSEAMTMIRLARVHHMQVLVGCMIESSVGIATMAQLAPLADYVDLDGNLLVVNDPYEGPRLRDGKLVLTDAPGNGTRYLTGT